MPNKEEQSYLGFDKKSFAFSYWILHAFIVVEVDYELVLGSNSEYSDFIAHLQGLHRTNREGSEIELQIG